MTTRASDILGADGPFAGLIEHYQVRETQLQLSDCIQDAMQQGKVLVAEAGTGIGKSFAYLVPAVLSGDKVIISTGTRHLQDQLFHNDLPRLKQALEKPVKTALLKGRSNYLCLHRMHTAEHGGFVKREVQAQIHQVQQWAQHSDSGDIADYAGLAEDSYVWPLLTSSADNCLGGECEHWNDCFVVKARKRAQDADIVVINHHLLLADMTLKDEGFAELLPEAQCFVIDEAHQLHDVASRFFGITLSSRQLIALARDTIAEQVNDAPDMGELREYAGQLENCARDFRLALGEAGQREAWLRLRDQRSVQQAMTQLDTALGELDDSLQIAAERSRGLDQCAQRTAALRGTLALFTGEAKHDSNEQSILWYETWSNSFMLHATPIDIASVFRKHTDDFAASWIFTSATLQVNHSFGHFAEALGLTDYQSGEWHSPFDTMQQCLLYLPTQMPEPGSAHFTAEMVERAVPVLHASRGRAFVLFTSFRALNDARRLLHEAIDYPILVQGDLPKHELLQQFRQTANAVLLGTSSFWEGVDVRGEALSCVIIDKLPFASPGDPVMQARIDAMRAAGKQPFIDYQVPQAVIALKQGIGRLIRDVNDYGVVMIADPRLTTKGYGRIFLNSLPAMPITRELSDVQRFYQRQHQETMNEAVSR